MSHRNRRRLLLTAVALGATTLSACTGSAGSSPTGPASASVSGTATTATSSAAGSTSTASATPGVSASPSGAGGSAPPSAAEWRRRLLAVSVGYNEARARCFADPVACVPVFDTTLGTHLSEEALANVRANLTTEASRGIRTRGIDPRTMYVTTLQVHDPDPVEAALSLCVVDKGVRFVAATGSASEKIIDDSEVTYFVVYRIKAGADGELRISSIDNTPFVPLRGKYGPCERYVR